MGLKRRFVKQFLDNTARMVRVIFFVTCLLFMVAGRPPVRAQVDDLQSERIGRVNDHLIATDKTVDDNRSQLKETQKELRDLEATVNEWKGAEDVWLKIISLLAGGGIILQIPGKFGKRKETML